MPSMNSADLEAQGNALEISGSQLVLLIPLPSQKPFTPTADAAKFQNASCCSLDV